MSKKTYWKDIFQAFSLSKGRFFSIFSLMMIGAIALIGLKVTTPNMETTAQRYIDTYQLFDLAVIGEYGLSEEDIAELNELPNATVEYGYFVDSLIAQSQQAVRLFSNPSDISHYHLTSGNMPTNAQEIVLSDNLKQHYAIGSTFEVAPNSRLHTSRYTVVGFAHSSEIWDTSSMGFASVGEGELTGYGVTHESAFNLEAYTIARIRYQNLIGVNYDTPFYQSELKKNQLYLEDILADNGALRLEGIRRVAEQEIADGNADIEQAEQELADAAEQLTSAEQDIEEGTSQLNSAQNEVSTNEATLQQVADELAQGSTQLELARTQLSDSKAQLDAAKTELDAKQSELATAKQQLDAAKTTLDTTKAQLDATQVVLAQAATTLSEQNILLTQAKTTLDSQQTALETAQQTLQQQRDNLLASGIDPQNDATFLQMEADVNAQAQQFSDAQQAYNQGLSTYQTEKASYDAHKAQYDQGVIDYDAGLLAYQENNTQYEAGLAQYNQGLASYQQGLADYEAGLATFEAKQAEYVQGRQQYESGLSELELAKQTIADQQAKLEDATQQLTTAKEDYAQQSTQAQEEIQSAKEDLSSAQEDLASLTVPQYTNYTRATVPGGEGYATYTNATRSISAVGNLFPIVLYLVAAMVTFTTMTRFVDEERSRVGLLKALGYTNAQVIRKFVMYGLVASVLGTITGIILGNFVVSPMISYIITRRSVVGNVQVAVYPFWNGVALLLAFVSAGLPAYWVARKELLHEPAKLLQAKPPVVGSRIWLERIQWLWSRMNFTQKVTARNIFRYKQRMLMTIFGVAGSVMLLFAGLGIRSSISGVVDTQFGELLQYDMIVVQKENLSTSEKTRIEEQLQESDVRHFMPLYYETTTEMIPNVADQQTINVMITDSGFADFVQLRNRASQETLELSNSGVIITENLARLYNVSVGDTIDITLNHQQVTVTVQDISELYAGHFMYMSAAYYTQLTQKPYVQNAYLVQLTDNNHSAVKQAAGKFFALDGVKLIIQNTALATLLATLAQSLQSVMLILIVLSLLLGVVILYNLTNINVAERIRELSTIKVLGFHHHEVTLYIYRETIVLSLIGIVAGLVSGYYLHRVILAMIGSDTIRFNPSVSWEVYAIPVVAIVGILVVLGGFVNEKLRRVDMLEALKVVE
ncbi:MAG: FtsX-like permease family protein [Aerococcaceae bacterium]|nr:FtsX-like permease family protein [Aerococcaceae bacterium]